MVYVEAIAVAPRRGRRAGDSLGGKPDQLLRLDGGGVGGGGLLVERAKLRSKIVAVASRDHLGALGGSRIGYCSGDPGGAVVAGLLRDSRVPLSDDVNLPGRLGDAVADLADDPVGILGA